MKQQQKERGLTSLQRDFTTPVADSLSLELSLQALKSIRQSTKFKYESDVLGLFDRYENKDSIYLCHLCGCSIDSKEVYARLIQHQENSKGQEKKSEEKKKKEKIEKQETDQIQRDRVKELIRMLHDHLQAQLEAIQLERKKLTIGADGEPKRPPQIIFRVNTVIDNLEEELNLLGGSKELLGSVPSKRKQICEHQIELHKKIAERAIYVNHDAIELIKKLKGFA